MVGILFLLGTVPGLAQSSEERLNAIEREIQDLNARIAAQTGEKVAVQAELAEAERERRAKVIHAEGELQASEKLLQAAQMLSQRSEAMQLRYLQTLTQVANERTSTIVSAG